MPRGGWRSQAGASPSDYEVTEALGSTLHVLGGSRWVRGTHDALLELSK
jgi:hypothetical protein